MKFSVALIFVSVVFFVIATAMDEESEFLEEVSEDREECAKRYKSCDKLNCCHNRRCRCNVIGQSCVCKSFYCEIFGTCEYDD